MKRFISILLCISLCFACSACLKSPEKEPTKAEGRETLNYPENLKGVWFCYYEIGDIFRELSESEAEERAEELFKDLAEKGINTVFFHVRAFADAMYESAYFPRSEYCAQGYDLLKIVIKAAHEHRLSLHAWVNPYRVAAQKEISDLPDTSPAVKLYKKSKQNLFLYKDGIYMNPARKGVQKLILNGIRELAENYEIDGVHFDDYFYPSAEKKWDKSTYAAYKNKGGTLSLGDFRRENVTALIEAVYALVKSVNENLEIGRAHV